MKIVKYANFTNDLLAEVPLKRRPKRKTKKQNVRVMIQLT